LITAKGSNSNHTIVYDGYTITNTGTEEIITVKGDGTNSSPILISLSNVRVSLQRMSELCDVAITDLSQADETMLGNLVHLYRNSHGSAVYEILLKEAQTAFHGKTAKVPGTVASFIIGCYTPTSYNGQASCSDLCAGSIPQPRDTPGWQPCQHLVIWIDGDGRIRQLHEDGSDNGEDAIIYIASGAQFNGFTQQDIHRLKGVGVKRVDVVKRNDDNNTAQTYSYITNGFVPIDTLQQVTATPATGAAPVPGTPVVPANGTSRDVVVTQTPYYSGWWIFWLILGIFFFIVIILLIIFFAYSSWGGSSSKTEYVESTVY